MAVDQMYADALTEIEALKARLAMAETVCTLFGWTGVLGNSDRDKAVEQAWSDWHGLYGEPNTPRDPKWAALIAELAAKRDEIRERTLRKIRGETEELNTT